jgi:hypothetical protein
MASTEEIAATTMFHTWLSAFPSIRLARLSPLSILGLLFEQELVTHNTAWSWFLHQ